MKRNNIISFMRKHIFCGFVRFEAFYAQHNMHFTHFVHPIQSGLMSLIYFQFDYDAILVDNRLPDEHLAS